jgi:DNA-binding beta-propeller fold protein YncE
MTTNEPVRTRSAWEGGRIAALILVAPPLLIVTPASVSGQATLDYRADAEWATLPEGRSWGAVTGVYPDPDGDHIWVLDRCGGNDCLGSELHPIFKFDLRGNLVANFGAGVFAWPHGFFVDRDGNVWVTEAGTGARSREAARQGKGHQVVKLSQSGEVLMRLGQAGVEGSGPDTFNGPSEVMVAPGGEIYVADGHGADGNNRIVKFSRDGRFLKQWGSTGPGPAAGEMSDPHALAMDSQGRIFVGDRRNNRIQIFDEEGAFLEEWGHFGPPSSIYIDADDVIYVTDTQTAALPPWIAGRRDAGWVRGIRIGDARTGRVTGFLPSDAEFVAADRFGNVYGAEVPGERLVKHLAR